MSHEEELQAADQAVQAAHSLIPAKEADDVKMRAVGLNTQHAEALLHAYSEVLDWLRNVNGLSVVRNNYVRSVNSKALAASGLRVTKPSRPSIIITSDFTAVQNFSLSCCGVGMHLLSCGDATPTATLQEVPHIICR